MSRAAEQRQHDDEAQMESEYLGLKPLERAVLWRLLEQSQRFRPYDSDALRFYQEKIGHKVSAQKAQTALENLRQHNPPLVWKSARSEYAVDDAACIVGTNSASRLAHGRLSKYWPRSELAPRAGSLECNFSLRGKAIPARSKLCGATPVERPGALRRYDRRVRIRAVGRLYNYRKEVRCGRLKEGVHPGN